MVSLKRSLTLSAVLLLAASGYMKAQQHQYPKPQDSEVEGKPAPGFTLRDQEGKDFRLDEHRGERLLLYFYRGYW